MTWYEILAAGALLVGSALALVATIGLHRFPDVFARMHAATKPATLGLALAAIAAALVLHDFEDVVKLALIVGFQFLTAPIAAHMIGRAAYRAGRDLSADTVVDDLAAKVADHPESTDDEA